MKKSKKEEILESGKAYFRISGEFLTDLAREYWTHNKERQAIELLVTGLSGMTEDIALKIVTGRKKLTGWNNDIQLVEEDDPFYCGIKLKSVSEILEDKRKVAQELKEFRELESFPVSIASPLGLIEVSRQTQEKLKKGEKTWHDEIKFRKRANYSGSNLQPAPIQELEEPIKLDPVLPDKTLSILNGWIDRDGNFYPCSEYAKHEETAARLGKSGKELDELGWVKVVDSSISMIKQDIFWDPEKPLTQAQIDTVWNWCQKHKIKFPNSLLQD